jgi:hypothetical protein
MEFPPDCEAFAQNDLRQLTDQILQSGSARLMHFREFIGIDFR